MENDMKKIAGLVTGLLLTATALAGYPEPYVKEGPKKTS
jgi:hypothetical protein